MRKVMGFTLMLMLACSVSAMAQMNMPGDSSKKTDKTSGSKMSMTGCISENDGKYMLTDKEHPNGVELKSSEDLKPHVGHTVTVTGTMDKMCCKGGPPNGGMGGMESHGKMSKGGGWKHDGMGMNVSSMKMVSEQCEMSKPADTK